MRVFPFLNSFGSDDASIFFGRERETNALLARIERDPIIVVNGLSGCGKSSLIKAGIIPRLWQTGHRIVYVAVSENIIEDLLTAIRRDLYVDIATEDYVAALEAAYNASGLKAGADQDDSRAFLRQALTDHFNEEELRNLCFDMGLDYDSFPAQGKLGKAREFIAEVERKDDVARLIEKCKRLRPKVPWKRALAEDATVSSTDNPYKKSSNAKPQSSQHIVLVVDQFEQALGRSHDPAALVNFYKGLERLDTSVQRFVTVVIALRADWLYFLDVSTRRSIPNLHVHNCIFTIDPLADESAYDAIVGPLRIHQIQYSEEVVADIISQLHEKPESTGPSVTSYIQPVQLQIVIRALFELAERREVFGEALSSENYKLSGGVETILDTYLADSFRHDPEAWDLLTRFIASDNRTARTLYRSELLSVPAATAVDQELTFLIAHGFIVAEEAEAPGEVYYRLAHDYLVNSVVEYLNARPEKWGWKLAEEWLIKSTLEWQDAPNRGVAEPLLPERDRYLHIYTYRQKHHFSSESLQMLTLASLRYGHEGLGHWLGLEPSHDNLVQLAMEALLAPKSETQAAALLALSATTRTGSDGSSMLTQPVRTELSDKLWREIDTPYNPARRDAAARALWTLGDFKNFEGRSIAGRWVFRRWILDHRGPILSYVGLVLLLFCLVLGGLVIRERLRGTWTSIYSLKAGATPLVVTDPGGQAYVVTAGGPGPREGNALFAQEESGWKLIGRDFAKGWPTSIVAIQDGTQTSFSVAVYGGGVIRSRDGGGTWEVSNTGLPSHGITALVADRDQARTLYAATDDWRGVLRSTDSGNSWDFYDPGDEIFGASISTLVYSRASGGVLSAGTLDGRILAHLRDSEGWKMSSGWSKGAISAMGVAPSDEKQVYAGTTRGIVLRSQDGGVSWDVLGQIGNEFNIRTIVVAPDNPTRLFVSIYGIGGYKIWTSADAGQHWQRVEGVGLPRTWVGSLTVTGKEPYRILAAMADGLFASADMGHTWKKEQLSAPLASIQGFALSSGPSKRVWVINNGSIYVNNGSILTRPQDQEHEWTLGKGLRAEIVRTIALDPTNPDIAYAGVLLLGEWSVFVTRDGGQTWQPTSPPAIQPGVPDTTALATGLTSQGKSVLYAGTIGCGIFRSTDGGQSWDTFGRSRCDQITDMPSDVSMLTLDSGSTDVVYAATGQTVFVSTDGGRHWRRQQPNINSTIMGMVADAVSPRAVYLVAGASGFWRSHDGGTSWQQGDNRPFDGMELSSLAAVPGKAGHLLVGSTNGGIWSTSDGGRTWRSIRENLTVGPITTIGTSQDMQGRILIGSASDGLALFVPGRIFGSGE